MKKLKRLVTCIFIVILTANNLSIIRSESSYKSPPISLSHHLNNKFDEINNKILSTNKEFENILLGKKTKVDQIVNIDKRTRLTVKKNGYELRNKNYYFSLYYKTNNREIIKSFYYKDNDSTYQYQSKRGKSEFVFHLKNKVSYKKSYNNTISIKFNENIYVTLSNYGKIKLSDTLTKEIYSVGNDFLMRNAYHIIKTYFPLSTYAKLCVIYNKKSCLKENLTLLMNHFREDISLDKLRYSSKLEEYAQQRVNFFTKNKLVPKNKLNTESPSLEGFSKISQFERLKTFDINDPVYEFSTFYSDPIQFVISMIDNLTHRAVLLSPNAKEVGIAYSKKHRLICFVISYDKTKAITDDFRMYPQHGSTIFQNGIEYSSDNIRGYPISIHTNGIYEKLLPEITTPDGSQIDFTGGSFHGNNARYVICKDPLKSGEIYKVKYKFRSMRKKIKSVSAVYKIHDYEHISRYDISRNKN